jgi:hypothetical protein
MGACPVLPARSRSGKNNAVRAVRAGKKLLCKNGQELSGFFGFTEKARNFLEFHDSRRPARGRCR